MKADLATAAWRQQESRYQRFQGHSGMIMNCAKQLSHNCQTTGRLALTAELYAIYFRQKLLNLPIAQRH